MCRPTNGNGLSFVIKSYRTLYAPRADHVVPPASQHERYLAMGLGPAGRGELSLPIAFSAR